MAIETLFDILGALFDSGGAIGYAIEKGADAARAAAARARRVELMRQQIATCSPASIASVADGPVALQGRARPLAGGVSAAPLSGRPAIGCRLRLDGVFEEDGDRVRRSLLDVAAVAEFELVEEGTGEAALVRPERCVPLLMPDRMHRPELAALIKPPLAEIVERACVPTSDLVTAVELRAVEHLLEPGEPVFAYGLARRELDPGGARAGYREVPQRVTLSSPPGGFLILADQRHDALLASLESLWQLLPEE